MVESLPPVPALDFGRAVGRHPECLNSELGRSGHRANAQQNRKPHPSSGVGWQKGYPQQGFGRSRCGLTTKIHRPVHAHGLHMRTEIAPGQTSDDPEFDLVMSDNMPERRVLLADCG